MHLDGQLGLLVGQSSTAGRKPVNEDSIGIRIPEAGALTTKGAVVAIADGVSAAEAGKEAAESCVRNFLYDYYATPDSWSVKKSAHQVLSALNRWLYGQGQRFIVAEKGYVSTFSLVVFKSRSAHLFHVGDTRIYRWRDGELEQLTRDHSTVISKDQAYLTRAMGLDLMLDVDYRAVDVDVGDVYFLSTDGVHDFIRDKQIEEVMAEAATSKLDDLEPLCRGLIDQAFENNSNDNLSCQMVRVDVLPLEEANDVYNQLTKLPFPPDLEPGMILDGYRVEKLLHASSRAQLYQVTGPEGELLVMKTPSVNFEDDPAYIERFVMESWVGKRIRNNHVVQVVDPVNRPQFLYYLVECVQGPTLAQWIEENYRPPIPDVVRLTRQIAMGLRAMHRKQILHQDIKPDNIVLDQHGQAKIIDFGSCYVAGVAEIATPFQRDIALGTETYSAPEYQLGRQPSERSDLFALAMVVFEMVTGELPYEGKLAQCHKAADFAALRYVSSHEINPMVPIWFDAALAKALSIHPEQRYGDISEFIHDLENPNMRLSASHSSWPGSEKAILPWKVATFVLAVSQLISLIMLIGRG